jgi:hypothetical protein
MEKGNPQVPKTADRHLDANSSVGQPISRPTFDVIVYPTKDVAKRHF